MQILAAADCRRRARSRPFCHAGAMSAQPAVSIIPTEARAGDDGPSVAVPGECWMLEICSAAVGLLPADSAQGSVLANVLPSLPGIFADTCSDAAPALCESLGRCQAAADDLRHLAVIHAGREAVGLLQKLEQDRELAGHAIAAVEALAVAGRTVNHTPRQHSPEECEPAFREFCDRVCAVHQASAPAGSVLRGAVPALVQFFGECGASGLNQLHLDRQAWGARAAQLAHLAGTFSRDEAAELCAQLDRTRSQADRLLNALGRLQSGGGASESGSAEVARVDSAFIDLVSETSVPDPVEPDVEQQAAALCAQADGCYRNDDLKGAENLYSEALRLDDRAGRAWLRRGRLRLLRRAAELAIDDLSRAIELNVETAQACAWRADAHVLAGRLEAALADYERSLKAAPDNFVVRYNRAVALRQHGLLDAALAECDELVGVNPDYAPLYLNRGLIWQARRERERAIAEFRTALRLRPDWNDVRDRLKQLGAPRASAGNGSATPAAASAERSTRRPLAARTVSRAASSESTEDDLALQLLVADQDTAPRSAALPPLARRPASEESDPAPPAANAPAPESGDPLDRFSLEFTCPGCGDISKVRWNRLQRGKVLSCPSCRRTFAAGGDGRLTEVFKTRAGRWKTTRRLPRAAMYRLIGGVVAACVVGALLWPGLTSSPREDDGLPLQLEPRARTFALAWLKGDVRTMRRLTPADQASQLFVWCMDNPPPTSRNPGDLERQVHVTVTILPSMSDSMARVEIHIDGLEVSRGRARSSLMLSWRQDGETWVFQPDLESKPAAGPLI
jgi:tetratricopeptide (TPR) repeat protein